jgi:hypothetical protein
MMMINRALLTDLAQKKRPEGEKGPFAAFIESYSGSVSVGSSTPSKLVSLFSFHPTRFSEKLFTD